MMVDISQFGSHHLHAAGNVVLRGCQLAGFNDRRAQTHAGQPGLDLRVCFADGHSKIVLNDHPPFEPRIKQSIGQRNLISNQIFSSYGLLHRCEAFLQFNFISFDVGQPVFWFGEELNDAGSFFAQHQSHFCSLEGILRNELTSSFEGLCQIPANYFTFCQDSVSMDENRYFPIGFGISVRSFAVQPSEEISLFSQTYLPKSSRDLLLQCHNECPLCKGAKLVIDHCHLLLHSYQQYAKILQNNKQQTTYASLLGSS